MTSPTERTFSIYELTEWILLQLNDQLAIIRVQRVCRTWRDIIQTSPALQKTCWYPTETTKDPPTCGERAWRLNRAFNRMGVPIFTEPLQGGVPRAGFQEEGVFNLEHRIYDKPGSWTTMLATWPPCKRMSIDCYTGEFDDQRLVYLVTSMKDGLLMGDIMAILAECQNRQQCGLDLWSGYIHFKGCLIRWEPVDWEMHAWEVFDRLPGDVSIKVAAEMPRGEALYPAFSLRRLDGCKEFLHELIPHRMVFSGRQEYMWEERKTAVHPVCKGEYKANLLVVREHQEGYLSHCSRIFRLLSDVKQS